MKSLVSTIMLASALAQLSPDMAVAQTTGEISSDSRNQQQQAEVARKQAEAARQQAESAKAQAEVLKRQAEEIRVQQERAVSDRKEEIKRLEIASRLDRERAGFDRENPNLAMEKVQKEVQKAVEKARAASQQALGQVDLSRVEAEVQRALAAADAAMQKNLYAQAAAALPAPPAPPALPATAKFGSFKQGAGFGSRRPNVRTLVVSNKPGDAKAIANLEEDLTVMWRILDKETERELGKDSTEKAMGIFISSGDSRGPSALFLDGYGALFNLSVRYPLVAPPKPKEEQKGETAPDSTWEKTRRELFGSPDGGGDPKLKSYRSEFSHPEVEYDAAKVEALKNSLLEALKNASNLRQLKPADFISVAVLGGGHGGSGDMFVYKTDSNKGRMSYSVTTTAGAAAIASSEPLDIAAKDVLISKFEGGRNSTLTIRVKKSDVDDFANGKTTLDAFRQKASINIY